VRTIRFETTIRRKEDIRTDQANLHEVCTLVLLIAESSLTISTDLAVWDIGGEWIEAEEETSSVAVVGRRVSHVMYVTDDRTYRIETLSRGTSNV
jgi:hypothetical protein